MTTNEMWLQRSRRAIWHPCTQMKMHEHQPLVPIVRAAGVWLYDAQGKRYLDAVSSWWVNLFGHAHPHINAALCDQLQRLEHVIFAGFTHEPAVLLAERLAALLPGLGHAFFASDGASAVEIALKMSAHYWRNIGLPQKNKFVSLENGYHGETLGALSIGDVALFREQYVDLLRGSYQVTTPDARRAAAGESAEAYALRCAARLEQLLQQRGAEIAAVVVEPLVQCAAGMAMYHPVYLRRARELCSQYGVHLIADEIAVGFGRTGKMFACEHAAVTPDLICLSKGITGGYLPLSVVLCTDAIYTAFYDDDVHRGFLHSHSYTGNALACRAALTVLEIFEQERVIEKNQVTAARLTALAKPLREHSRVANFRQQGMVWAFDVVSANATFSRDFTRAALDAGVLLRPIGNTVYFMPPYTIDEDEMNLLIDTTLHLINDSH